MTKGLIAFFLVVGYPGRFPEKKMSALDETMHYALSMARAIRCAVCIPADPSKDIFFQSEQLTYDILRNTLETEQVRCQPIYFVQSICNTARFDLDGWSLFSGTGSAHHNARATWCLFEHMGGDGTVRGNVLLAPPLQSF